MLKLQSSGSFSSMEKFLQRMKNRDQYKVLAKYGPMGVAALQAATPKESAETAQSWTYEIVDKPGYFAIHWYNTHEENGAVIAVLLQYGHATGNGGHVEGRDYINPAMRPIFDQMVADMWREVTK